MIVIRKLNWIVFLLLLRSFVFTLDPEITKESDDNDDDENSSDDFLVIPTRNQSEDVAESTAPNNDDWITHAIAIRDIAYYLRNYKFNEWDRRYDTDKPDIKLIGYFKQFPIPSLRTLHWKVAENCDRNFYSCIKYLHTVVESDPMTRRNDPITIVNDKKVPINQELLEKLESECQKSRTNSERSGTPFDGPIEKYRWRTSAAYYMCWYTMLETPALAKLGEPCDNYANCLDESYGAKNKDSRADDTLPYACAMYSFCPDVCCPQKHLYDLYCYNNEQNPCYLENSKGIRSDQVCKAEQFTKSPKTFTDMVENEDNRCFADKIQSLDSSQTICRMERKQNQNFKDIIANKWNVTCFCRHRGFTWDPRSGKCEDIDECALGEHDCDETSEDCLNLLGNYKCVCKWTHVYNTAEEECVLKNESTLLGSKNSLRTGGEIGGAQELDDMSEFASRMEISPFYFFTCLLGLLLLYCIYT